MGIKEILQQYGERRRKLKEYEEELRLRKTAEQRMKSSEERDLEDYVEKERQKQIKEKLKQYKQKATREWWASPYKIKLNSQRNGVSLNTNGGFLGKGVWLK